MARPARWIRGGIDEAGYGPRLGPLVTALVAFDAGDVADGADLWDALSDAVCRDAAGAAEDGRLPVADSKLLHRGGPGFALLECVALSFSAFASAGTLPRTGLDFVARHGDLRLVPHGDYPWYQSLAALELPLRADPAVIAEGAGKLSAAAAARGIRPLLLAVAPLLEREFNERVERHGTKARAVFDLNVDLLMRLREAGGLPARVLCDRHGGRRYYEELLVAAFPLEPVLTRSEARGRSGYRVGRGRGAIELEYVVEGEKLGFEVALASVFAKYTRELFVECLNRFFAARLPGLKRTAGYYNDAGRFLEDLDKGRALLPAERSMLVRIR